MAARRIFRTFVEISAAGALSGLALFDGGSVAVSEANSGRVVYSQANQRLERSENGGAYVPLGYAVVKDSTGAAQARSDVLKVSSDFTPGTTAGETTLALATQTGVAGTWNNVTFNSKGIATGGTLVAYALASTTLTAGAGLTGGGDLSAPRTINVVTADGTIVVNPDSIQVGVIQTANIADAAVTTLKVADLNVTTAKLADGAVTTVKIADANVTMAKLANLAGTSVIGRAANSTGVPAAITATADAQFLRRESGTLGFGAIVNADLPTSGVSSGTWNNVTVNDRGIVTGATNAAYALASSVAIPTDEIAFGNGTGVTSYTASSPSFPFVYKRATGRTGFGTANPLNTVDVLRSDGSVVAIGVYDVSGDTGTASMGVVSGTATNAAITLTAFVWGQSVPGDLYGITGGAAGSASLHAKAIGGKTLGRMFVGTDSAAPLHLVTNNTTQVTVDANGRLGVGISSGILNDIQIEKNFNGTTGWSVYNIGATANGVATTFVAVADDAAHTRRITLGLQAFSRNSTLGANTGGVDSKGLAQILAVGSDLTALIVGTSAAAPLHFTTNGNTTSPEALALSIDASRNVVPRMNTNAALVAGVTDAFTYLSAVAGIPGTPAHLYASGAPAIVDTTGGGFHWYATTWREAVQTTRTVTGTAGRIVGGGDLSANRTFDLATSGVAAGTYNNLTVDTFGRATGGSNVAYALGSNTITAGTGLSGGTQALSSNPTISMPSIATAGTYGGGSSFINSIVIDAQGRIVGTPTANAPGAGGALTQAYTTIKNSAGTALTQRFVARFTNFFAVNDTAGLGGTPDTLIDANFSGVTVGTYNNVTVDGYGRVTGGSNVAYLPASALSITATQVAFATGTNTLGGSARFTYAESGTDTTLALGGSGSRTILSLTTSSRLAQLALNQTSGVMSIVAPISGVFVTTQEDVTTASKNLFGANLSSFRVSLASGSDMFTVVSDGSIVPRQAALATNASVGYQYVRGMAGAPIGVPASYTGTAAVAFDSSNVVHWFNDPATGYWRQQGAAFAVTKNPFQFTGSSWDYTPAANDVLIVSDNHGSPARLFLPSPTQFMGRTVWVLNATTSVPTITVYPPGGADSASVPSSGHIIGTSRARAFVSDGVQWHVQQGYA